MKNMSRSGWKCRTGCFYWIWSTFRGVLLFL